MAWKRWVCGCALCALVLAGGCAGNAPLPSKPAVSTYRTVVMPTLEPGVLPSDEPTDSVEPIETAFPDVFPQQLPLIEGAENVMVTYDRNTTCVKYIAPLPCADVYAFYKKALEGTERYEASQAEGIWQVYGETQNWVMQVQLMDAEDGKTWTELYALLTSDASSAGGVTLDPAFLPADTPSIAPKTDFQTER